MSTHSYRDTNPAHETTQRTLEDDEIASDEPRCEWNPACMQPAAYAATVEEEKIPVCTMCVQGEDLRNATITRRVRELKPGERLTGVDR